MLGAKSAMTLGGVMLIGSLAYLAISRMQGPAPSGAPMVLVQAPDLQALPVLAQEGAALFEAKCAGCHGAQGSGRDGFGPPLIHPIYEPNHHGDDAIFRAMQVGAQAHHWTFGDMPPVAGTTPEMAQKIIAYIRAVQVTNGIY